MPVEDAYADVPDLRTGDIPLPRHMGDGSSYIKGAAEEIDAAIGHIYVTPIKLDSNVAANRPAILLLKKINWLVASGRLILDLAAAGEDASLHAYGNLMLREGIALLKKVTDEEIILTGAERIPVPDGEEGNFTGPAIFNEDPESLVQAFYDRHNSNHIMPTRLVPPAPYGNGVR